MEEGAPLNLGEVTGGIGAREFGQLAPNAAERIPAQNIFLQKEAQKLLGGKYGAVQRQGLLRQGIDKTAEQIAQSNPIIRNMPNGIDFVKNSTRDLQSFKAFTDIVGPEKSHTMLFKNVLENSMDDSGIWDGGKLFNNFVKNRDMFNYNAANLERLGIAKATDLKASWNRFIHANALVQSSRSTSLKGMEMALTNAGISAAVGIPLLGPFSYPAWRAMAGAGRILLVGPKLGAAFNNPKVVEQFVKLTTNSAKNPSNVSAIKEIAKWAWKNGVSFKSTEGAEFMINPNDMSKPYPVEQDMPMPELVIPPNLWKD